MREIVLDTETTGLDPLGGDRIVEIGCVELKNSVPVGPEGLKRWYVNPERFMPPEAQAVHGLSDQFLADKPVFAEIAGEFLDFIGDAALVIHNAKFDLGFLNAELGRLRLGPIDEGRAITDTVALARRKFPGSPASLDALCRRFGIDNSQRTLHGALLDAQILAEVYVELLGGRQQGLGLGAAVRDHGHGAVDGGGGPQPRRIRTPRPHAPLPDELDAHAALVAKMKAPIWSQGAP